jgi:glycosyltransferase involved in cell wall biosynthesis
MPVVALATTEAPEAIPPHAGIISTRVEILQDALRRLIRDPDAAREAGRHARAAALARYGLQRFLVEWDTLLAQVVAEHRFRSRRPHPAAPTPAHHRRAA